MALMKCKECGKAVSDKAKKCMNCGAATKRAKLGCGTAILIVTLAFTAVFILESKDSSKIANNTPEIQKTHEEIKQITKKDGTVDSRKNDLDELCKDWVYFKAKIFKHSGDGDEKAAAKARNNFTATNRDLSEYRDSDVSATCAKYETREFIEPYMR